jgi:hypothetical protein
MQNFHGNNVPKHIPFIPLVVPKEDDSREEVFNSIRDKVKLMTELQESFVKEYVVTKH